MHFNALVFPAIGLVWLCSSCGDRVSPNKDSGLVEPISPIEKSTNFSVAIDTSGMIAIPGGIFRMGAIQAGEYQREYPAHQVSIGSIFMDATEVTNADYQIFVDQTGYLTVAERKVDWEELQKQLPPDTPKPNDDMLQPGSIIFSPNPDIVNLNNHYDWWDWENGANWKNINGAVHPIAWEANNPVVQVAFADAVAYCAWKGKRLPTEAEWEHAAKGGLEDARFSWGQEDPLKNPKLTNIFQGKFPLQNTGTDGYQFMAPVGSFPPNG